MSYVLILIMLVLLIVSITMLSGKGTFLLKADERNEKLYDTKKLAKIMGAALLDITIIIGLQTFLGDRIPTWLIMLGIGVAILSVLYGKYVLCRRKDSEAIEEVESQEKKPIDKFKLIGGGIGAVILIAFVSIIMFVGSVGVDMQEDSVTFKATLTTSKRVQYKNIASIEKTTTLGSSRRTGGISNIKINAGHFKNDDFGSYLRYTYVNSDTYIIIMTKDKSVIVVNDESDNKTDILYKQLMAKLP